MAENGVRVGGQLGSACWVCVPPTNGTRLQPRDVPGSAVMGVFQDNRTHEGRAVNPTVSCPVGKHQRFLAGKNTRKPVFSSNRDDLNSVSQVFYSLTESLFKGDY